MVKVTRFSKYLIVIFVVVLVAACAPSRPEISVSEAWIRPDPLMENAAGYMVISNSGGTSDKLIGVTVEFAMMASVHESVEENGVHKMVARPNLEIPANGEVIFQPLSFHVMIMDMMDGVQIGGTVTLRLEFENSGVIMVEAEVRSE